MLKESPPESLSVIDRALFSQAQTLRHFLWIRAALYEQYLSKGHIWYTSRDLARRGRAFSFWIVIVMAYL